jgi:hypothetical protein
MRVMRLAASLPQGACKIMKNLAGCDRNRMIGQRQGSGFALFSARTTDTYEFFALL